MQSTLERMQASMTKKHDSNARPNTIMRTTPYLTNHRPRHGFVDLQNEKFTKYCTCYQKCIRECEQSQKDVTNSLPAPC